MKKTNKNVKIKVLYLEDNQKDVEIVRELLLNEGFELEMDSIEAEKEFVSNLRHCTYDVILSDFRLPGFDAFGALKHACSISPDVPFICLSGTVGDETAVELLKQGAVDYLLKENIKKLPSVIMRAIDEAKKKKALKDAENRLREKEESYRSLLESAFDAIITANSHGNIVSWNKGAEKIFGYSYIEVVDRPITFIMPEQYRAAHIYGMTRLQSGGAPTILGKTVELEGLRKDGTVFPLDISVSAWETAAGRFFTGIIRDTTERKRVEDVLTYERNLLRSLMENTPDHIYFKDIESRFIRISAAQARRFGINDPVLAMGKNDFDFFNKEHASKAFEDEKTIMQTGRPLINLEEHEVTSEGKESWVSTTKVPLRDHNGIIIGTFGISRDITDKKKAEEKLRESSQRLNFHLENSPMGVIEWDADFIITRWSGEAEKIFGWSRTETIGKPMMDLKMIYEDDIPLVQSIMQQLADGSSKYIVSSNRNYTKSKRIIYCEWYNTVLMNSEGKLISILSQVLDVTERKHAEELLRTSEEKYRSVAQSANAAIITTDSKGLISDWNRGAENIFGYTVPEVIGKSLDIVIPQHKLEQYINEKLRIEQSVERSIVGKTIEFEGQHKNGKILPLELSLAEWETSQGKYFTGIIRDVTERKQADAKLRESEEQFRHSFEYAAAGICTVGIDFRFQRTNSAFRNMLGYNDNELKSFTFTDITHPDDVTVGLAQVKKMLADEINNASFEKRYVTKNKETVWGYVSISLIRDVNRQPQFFIVQIINITERKRAEQELLRLQFGIERSNDAIFVTDILGVIQYINPAFTQIYGYSSHEAVGKTPRILKSGKFTPYNYKQFWDTLLSKNPVTGEIINKTKDGRFISVEVSNNPILDEKNNIIGFMGIHRDITLRKQTEEKAKNLETQLQQAQKLESLGTLASGIAHDFNNILGIILGHSSLLQMLKENPEKQTQSIEAITKATQRGAALVKQLLTFARKTETVFATVNINDTIKEINKLLIETLHKTIVITTSLQQDLPTIIGDSNQIHQVFLNLCVNARDAMPKGGTLSISTSSVGAESIKLQSVKIIARRYVKIEVTDTGMGMDETTRQRIFEPFFTTKGIGKGTGLGLSVVFGIVEHHNGFIDVRSVPSEGTCFTLYLPIPERALHEMQSVGKDLSEIRGGTETILVIEDEVMLMELVKASLISKGYTVLTADDGMRAIEMYQKHKSEIALVLSDLGLPTIEGHDVFKKIREINPQAKFIAASGYIDPDMKSEMFKAGMKNFIQKPYMFEEVLQKIRDVIDAK